MTFLLNSFEDASGCFLLPPGTSPHVVANVLKQFFATLPEPLLTYKCAVSSRSTSSSNPELVDRAVNHACRLQLSHFGSACWSRPARCKCAARVNGVRHNRQL